MDDIKCRFKESKSVVELLASNTWSNVSQNYQRAHQDDFLHEVRTPLRVRDVIPESRLAQYCNSEYGEWEECYKDTSKLSIFCSCVNDDESRQEPWMLPEVEEAFVSLAYTPSVEEIELVQFQKSHKCKLPDNFRKFPFYASFSEAEDASAREELMEHKPVELTVETFEEMILRLKIRCDAVKHLWSRYSQAKSEDEIEEKQILKSRFGNTFAVEKKNDHEVSPDWILDKCHIRRMDFSNLQYLSDTIRALKGHYFHLEKFSRVSETDVKDTTPTTRRLYSDVLRENHHECLAPLVEEPLYSQAKRSCMEEPLSSDFFMEPPPTCSTGIYTNYYENVTASKNCSYENTYCAHTYGNVYCHNSQNTNLHNSYMHKELVYSNFYQHSSLSRQSYTPTWFAPTRNPPVFASPPLPYLTAQPSRSNQPYPMFYLRTPNVQTYHYSQNPQQWATSSTQQFSSDPQCVGNYGKVKTKSVPDAMKRHASYEFTSQDKRLTVKPALSTSSLEHRGDSNRVLPVSSSLSEDLERQALEQYQNSNENLYRELEKQAEEQYDHDDPMENDLRSPYLNRYRVRR
ncbi:uncharacterized protein LOC116159664 isoform X2 [Photinus pyralis]|uniref:uncharacterized protein LOC116158963 isoform X2 n=1 Tax=Photinus pyralis TaxID=7054 RepID=UPI0012674DA3|nr:uncharacterized protein LOC116158963 isoform X2 [Photinus pyralis]XP_031328558.1 uncharacterized protein LOC116159664 isoform X2 [Photinus pyralis]